MAVSGGNQTVCPTMKITSHGSWHGDNPLDYALPLAIVQICIVVAFTRTLALLLKPFRQPRVIAEIIGGILLGPSAFGRNKKFLDLIFPSRSLTVLDTLANIGLLFFLFLVGLELDLRAIRRTGKRSLGIAIAGICFPFLLGIGTAFVLQSTISKGVNFLPFLVFMGVSLSITAFPVLARILAELKLLTTDVGRIAMSAAAVNDVAAWILLALAIALSDEHSSPLISLWVFLSGSGFVLFAAMVLRPLVAIMARRSPDGEPINELYVCATLCLVLAAGFVTDVIGIHALFGAFVIGIIVPKEGDFAGVMIEKVEDVVSGLFLPLYFASSGLKTNVATIKGAESWGLLFLVIFTACLGKIGATMIVSTGFRVPVREALTLGLLMNTKGLVELIVLNIGKDRKVLNDQAFAILVLMALVSTFMTTPLVTAIYHPARKVAPYKNRTIQRKDSDAELRLLSCFYSARNIPTMINLIESSRGTRRRGLIVYAMHLMELSERSSAISMVHKARRNGLPFWNKRPSNNHIVVAFEAYQQLSHVSIRSMTAISHLSSMHIDICTSAHQKRVALIIIPFHKQQRLDGSMESLGHGFRYVNQRVLHHAPCSVGILVDRGLGGTTQVVASEVSYTIIVPFFGGKDDREAAAYGARMAEHPGISLRVVRFVTEPGKFLLERSDQEITAVDMEANEKSVNEEFLSGLQGPSINFEEKVITVKRDIVDALKGMNSCNLFLVGRRSSVSALNENGDSPELGPVGNFLASSEFSTTASVLILQQYDPSEKHSPVVEEVPDFQEAPDTPGTGLTMSF